MERVVLAFENENTSRKVRALLEGAGLARGLICRTAAEVRLLLGQQQIPTLVCGYKLPDATAAELFFDLPAKEWLMEQRGMDEGQAHRLLQQRSMICGRKLAETARLLLEREAGLALYG